MCPCVHVCIQVCFVLYVIYSQHCKHTETIIHVLALIHWIWLTWLEHHKRSNDLGWMRTQWKIKIEGFWRASGGPLKSPPLIVRLMFRSWSRSCHRVRKWEIKSSSSSSAGGGTEWVLFPSSEKNRFLVKEPSWLWRGWTMDQHKREAGGLFTQAFIEEDWVYAVLISPMLVKSVPIWSQCESVLVPLMVRRQDDTSLPQAVGKPKTLAQMETKSKTKQKESGPFCSQIDTPEVPWWCDGVALWAEFLVSLYEEKDRKIKSEKVVISIWKCTMLCHQRRFLSTSIFLLVENTVH